VAADFPRTAGQSAARLIREQILSGSFAPGATLNQNELAQALGMSRIPIRDALRSLADEGLVDMRAHQSASVTPLSLDDLEELYELRLAIEPNLCMRALRHLTEDDLEEAERVVGALAATDDATESLRLNNRFHEILYRRAGRPRSIEIIQRARQATGRYFTAYRRFEAPTVNVEHELILEAARAGHARRLGSLVTAHLSDGYETMVRSVAEEQRFPAREEQDGEPSTDGTPSATRTKEGMHR
jgi:DNA-binding GntR family transcriptional regulator